MSLTPPSSWRLKTLSFSKMYSMPRRSALICTLASKSLPACDFIPSRNMAFPSLRSFFSCSVSLTPLISSGMNTFSAFIATTSLVSLSMLMKVGTISPLRDLRSTTRPMLPVSSRFFLSSSEKICPKYGRSRSGFWRIPWMASTTGPLADCWNDRRASVRSTAEPKFMVIGTIWLVL